MSHMISHFLVLVFLMTRSTTLGKPHDSTLECGEDKSCAVLAQLMSTVNKLNEKLDKGLEELKTGLNKTLASMTTTSIDLNERLDKQAKGLEELKWDLNKSLASTAAISIQLGRHSTDLLSHDGRLR